MFKPLYSPTDGAWKLAYALQRKHPVTVCHMDTSDSGDWGFSKYKDKLELRSLMTLKSAQMENRELKATVNNQLQYIHLSEFLLETVFLQAREELRLNEKDYGLLLLLFKNAIRSEPFPFAQHLLTEHCKTIVKRLMPGKAAEFNSATKARKFLRSVYMRANKLVLIAAQRKPEKEDDIQARHIVQHSAMLINFLSFEFEQQLAHGI